MRVAVIGAGFAGLAAATELTAGGADVRVFEARDRVGGRVWSATVSTPSGDAVVERGGEFILQGYDELRRYAQELGIRLIDTGMNYYQREPRGVAGVDARMMADAGDDIAEHIAAHESSSIDEVLDALSLTPDLAESIRCRIEISCALESDALSVDVMSHVASLTPRPSRRLAGGNQGLALGLADRLREPNGRLHFAGEYSAGELAGLMEGALRSGQRAAAEVLRESHPPR